MEQYIKYNDDKVPYIQLGHLVVRLEDEEPSDEVKEIARVELRETPDVVQPAIEEMRLLTLAETNLHVPVIDEFFIAFLRPCKYYPKSAFERMKKFYKLKQKHPKLFEDLYPMSVRHAYEQDILTLLPLRDKKGCRMLLMEVGKKWKPSKVSLDDLFRSVLIAITSSMREPTTQICGGLIILDFDGLSLNHIMQFTPSFAAMILEWVQDVLTLRLKAVHIFNNSYIFNMLFAIFKPFIREKLRKRIFFHGKDTKSLTKHISPDVLPPKYGGTMDAPMLEGRLLADLYQQYQKEFEMANAFGYDSSN
jgi:hypothetical protein